MYRIAKLERRSWVILDRRYVFVLLRVEKLLSAVALLTPIVMAI